MIISFHGEYRFLSNFWPAKVVYNAIVFPTVENAYQAAKSLDIGKQKLFVNCRPGEAKFLGKRLDVRTDWDEQRISIMRRLLEQKFKEIPELTKLLLATGTRELIEGNYWHDTFWGVCNGVGENNLGKLIMEIRRELNASL